MQVSSLQRIVSAGQGAQLAQSRPDTVTASLLYGPADGVQATLKTVIVANVTAASAKYSLFHDDDGTTYTEDTALFFEVSLAANTTEAIELPIFMSNSDGNLAVKTDTTAALTFTLYGEEVQVRAR